MKLSELKELIKEEREIITLNNPYGLMNLNDKAQDEIDITIEMGQALLDDQYMKEGEIQYNDFDALKQKLIFLSQRSDLQYGEAFAEFIEGNRNNTLPNASSGSFFTALIDIDSLLGAMGYEDERYSDEEWDDAVKYWRKEINKLKGYRG